MLTFFIGLLILIIAIILIWRIGSRRYSLPCPSWLAYMVELDNPFVKIHRAAHIVENLKVQPGMVVLDAGCGPGRVTIPLAKAVGTQGKVVAVDIQAEMLARAEKKAKAENLTNIHYVQTGLGENKLDKNYFDRVVLVTVLGEIPNREAALQEIFSVLKPGGFLSITETIFDPSHYQSMQTVLKLAHAIGFQDINRLGNFVAYTLHLQKPN